MISNEITNVSAAMKSGESITAVFTTGLKGFGTALTSSLTGGLVAAAGVAAVVSLVASAYSAYKQSLLEAVQTFPILDKAHILNVSSLRFLFYNASNPNHISKFDRILCSFFQESKYFLKILSK